MEWQVGDIITFEKVIGWSRVYNQPTQRRRQFVITKAGNRKQINWYPYLIDKGPYRTVVKIPSKLKVRTIKGHVAKR